MKTDPEISAWEIVAKGLALFWSPAMEAIRLQEVTNMQSIEDVSRVAIQAGYEVSLVDLPATVNGFARIIEGTPHIAVNRAKCPEDQTYSMAHELGHCVLHLAPKQHAQPVGFESEGFAEFEAHIFAAMLVFNLTGGAQRERLLRQNPESMMFPTVAVFGSILVLVIALIVHIWSSLRPRNSAE